MTIKKWSFQEAINTTAGVVFGSKVSQASMETKALRPLLELTRNGPQSQGVKEKIPVLLSCFSPNKHQNYKNMFFIPHDMQFWINNYYSDPMFITF